MRYELEPLFNLGGIISLRLCVEHVPFITYQNHPFAGFFYVSHNMGILGGDKFSSISNQQGDIASVNSAQGPNQAVIFYTNTGASAPSYPCSINQHHILAVIVEDCIYGISSC